jgi:hypothetical protein
MEKIEVIRRTNVGARIAEDEKDGLHKYFQKTYLWEQILNEEIDIVFGSKGSGKSAIYNFLSHQTDEIFDKNGIITFAENPRGTVAFKDLNNTPPTDQAEFRHIWKLYFVLVITQKLQEFNYNDRHIKIVIEKLQDSNLMARRPSLTSLVKMVRDFVRNAIVEPNVSLSETTGMIENIGVKISLNEPSTALADRGVVSVDYLYECLNSSLEKNGFKIWVAIDRLDAVFQDNFELEANALKTLFQVYIDLMSYPNVRLLIFFRDDIWNRIIENGFRESSHLTKKELITWDESSLFHLIMSRLKQNESLLIYFGKKSEDFESEEEQKAFFDLIFQKETENSGIINFKWIIDKLQDGKKDTTPRELIHLINSAFKEEVKRIIERGSGSEKYLISDKSILKARKEVSKTKLETILSEYPTLKIFINRLKGKKVSSSFDELRKYWGISKKETKIIADNLIKIGVLYNKYENRVDKDALYTIPYLYRGALGY